MGDTFDVDVLGAGSTGTNVAGSARGNDLSAAIVESELVGGEWVGDIVAGQDHEAWADHCAVSLSTLWHAVPAFPTVSEVWVRLLEADRSRS